MNKQKGVTLSGFLLWSIVLIVFLLLVFRVGPAYFENYVIEKQLKAIANDASLRNASRAEIERAFVNRSTVEDIKAVQPRDLDIVKQGDGIVISASYTTCVPLFGNARACMDFTPSSGN